MITADYIYEVIDVVNVFPSMLAHLIAVCVLMQCLCDKCGNFDVKLVVIFTAIYAQIVGIYSAVQETILCR